MRMLRYAGLVLVMLSVSVACLAAEKTKEGFPVVSSEQLKGLLISKPAGLVLIDARTPQEYQEVHIQSAINIPLGMLECPASVGIGLSGRLI